MLSILSSRQRNALRMAWRFIAPYRGRVFGALLALMFTAAITLSMGQGIKLLVDQGLATQSPAALQQSIGLFFVLVLALAIGTFTRFYLVSWIGERFVADIRKRVFNHLIELHPGFYESNRSSEIQSRLTADTTLLQSVIGSSLSMALRNLIMLVGGSVLLVVTNAKLSGIVLMALPLVVAPILIFGRRVRALSRQSQDRVADVGSYVGEVLGQIKTVQAYNHQNEDKRRFGLSAEAAFDTARQRIAQRAWLITVVIVLVLGAVGVMLWVGGMDVIAGRISGGELAAFVFYSLIVGSAFANPVLAIPMAIIVLLIVAAFAVPAVWTRLRDNTSEPQTLGEFETRGIMTNTGRLAPRDAAIQVLILPVLLVVWGLAVAVIAAVVA